MPPNELSQRFFPEWHFIFSVGTWDELAARRQSRIQEEVESAGLEFLGEGAFGCVYTVNFVDAESKINHAMPKMVMKFTKTSYNGNKPDMPDTYSITNEEYQAVNVAKIQDSPNFVKVFDWKVYAQDAPAILMEAGGEELFQLIYEDSRVAGNEAFIARCFRDIVEGISTLMEEGYVHKDLKPDNVVWQQEGDWRSPENGRAKIIDYGMATTEGASGDFGGTHGYMPPEYKEEHPDPTGNDIWALGVILYELVFSTTILNKTRAESVEQLKNISSDCHWNAMCLTEVQQLEMPSQQRYAKKERSHSAIRKACELFPYLFKENVTERLMAFNNIIVKEAKEWEKNAEGKKRATQEEAKDKKTEMMNSFSNLLKNQLPKLNTQTRISAARTGENCTKWCSGSNSIYDSSTTCVSKVCYCGKGYLPVGPPHVLDMSQADSKRVPCKSMGPEYECKFIGCDKDEQYNLQLLPEFEN